MAKVEAEILGHIDCPSCGHDRGMRITPDKNGEPFGFCEANCDQQLRVGGKARRVELFYKAHPGIRRPGGTAQPLQVAGAVTGEASKEASPATVTEPKEEKIPVTVTEKKPGRAAFSLAAL